MKILLITPLYPPDIASHGPYAKELAMRLKDEHEISILTYGYIPEEVEGVHITVVPKSASTPIRLCTFIIKLYALSKKSDVIYVLNGPSVELPSLLISLLSKTNIVLYEGDKNAHIFSQQNKLYKLLHLLIQKSVSSTIPHNESLSSSLIKPEIIPFEARPNEAIDMYEVAWKNHLQSLLQVFKKNI